MRRIWIGFLIAGLLPIGVFYVLYWTGLTDALGYVSTTNWMPGSPSLLDLLMLVASMVTWSWTKGFAHIFIGAAAIVAILDFSGIVPRATKEAK